MRSRGHKARGEDQSQGHQKFQGQGQPFRGKTFLRPRTGRMLEAKAKDTHASVLQKKSSKYFFWQSPIHRRTQDF